MKEGIHPQYYPNAKVKCACGNEWTTGSTLPEINTSICSNCHPFYTGQEKIVDTRGRVEKFKKRLEKADSVKKTLVSKKPRQAKNRK
ncbi:MAG TPA: 50S ribosomal protein L31 [Candidatus Paceibacterota bacterium]|nr:50S ribosomal protein L31 [Candidatus Paceibacterota bacterium]